MSLSSKTGSDPILENRSVMVCKRLMSFSISVIVTSSTLSAFIISNQPINDDSGVPI